ncbi:hypothetical protein TNCV_4206531 [Trichonephila clavipes]|nr:hypothetical protein TNCV_4206531 [Trichonephila clavipes]
MLLLPSDDLGSGRRMSNAIRSKGAPTLYSCSLPLNLGGRTGKILRPSSVALKSKNQEINRLQLAVKLPWAIFFESVDTLS